MIFFWFWLNNKIARQKTKKQNLHYSLQIHACVGLKFLDHKNDQLLNVAIFFLNIEKIVHSLVDGHAG